MPASICPKPPLTLPCFLLPLIPLLLPAATLSNALGVWCVLGATATCCLGALGVWQDVTCMHVTCLDQGEPSGRLCKGFHQTLGCCRLAPLTT